jgi:retinol dehydrogenase 12
MFVSTINSNLQGTNVVGHFVFAKLVLPAVKAAAKTGVPNSTRIVWTSSNGHGFAPNGFINFDDVNLTNESTWAKYGQSKAV